ncbi:MAG: hypothetical protein RQM92_09605 [Candidatus Syntrophopropionicum ammoniitolerans]
MTKPTRALELWRQVGSIMGFATETQDRAINENWQQVANISETTDRLTNVKNVIETEKRLADVTDIAQYQRLKQKNEAVTERLKHFSASDSHMSGQMRGQRLGVEARARANVINLAEYRNIRAYATGGFASRPSIFGEAGPEAAIPLSSRMRGRALTLWEETGRRLGVKAYAYGGFADTPSICGEAGPEAIIPLTKPTRALELWRQVGSIMGFATETQDRAINENWQQVANISETTDRLTNVKNVIETEKRLADVTDIAQYQRLKQKNEAVTERLKHFSASDSHMSGQMRGQRLGVEARARANVINLAEYRNIRAYATGGFASRPSIFGEAGPEAAIPLSSRMRGRALTLWEETGRRLGVKAYAYGGFADTVQALPVAAGWEHNVPVNPAPSIPATTATVNLNFDLAGLVGQVVIENQEDIDKAIGKITVKLAEGLEKTFQNMTRSN